MARRKRSQNGWQIQKLRDRARRTFTLCEMPNCLCPAGRLIDKGLHYLDDWSFSIDHIVPVSVDPSLEYVWGNIRPAHRKCNNVAQPSREEPSRAW